MLKLFMCFWGFLVTIICVYSLMFLISTNSLVVNLHVEQEQLIGNLAYFSGLPGKESHSINVSLCHLHVPFEVNYATI